jgi:hypothetical protein
MADGFGLIDPELRKQMEEWLEGHPGGWQAPSWTTPTPAESTAQLSSQQWLYFNWLSNQLANKFLAGTDDNLGDPNRVGTPAFNILEKTLGDLLAGMPEENLYGYKGFLADYGAGGMPPGQLVAGGRILQTADGRFLDPSSGLEYDPDTALTMIRDWLGTKTDDTLTAAEEAQLDLALKDLAWQKEKYSTLSAADKAQLDFSYAQLQQTRNEWLAGVLAEPSRFIEGAYAQQIAGQQPYGGYIQRWLAERLPQGAEMPEAYRTTTPAGAWEPTATWGGAQPTAPAGWTMNPSAYLTMLQARGVPTTGWQSNQPGTASFLNLAKQSVWAGLPTPEGVVPWSSFHPGGAMYGAGSSPGLATTGVWGGMIPTAMGPAAVGPGGR